jgi:ribonuclease T1
VSDRDPENGYSVSIVHSILRLAVLALLVAGPALALSDDLRTFARHAGLRDADAFVETVASLRKDGRLPSRYLTKNEAARAGWRPGDDLCRSAPGKAIGGDRFGNREGRLPRASGRTWYEADLDFNCGRRGVKRLVWSSDGLIYVTTNHYETFREVPR